jgi:8-amino-7-oxononanoate synthase
MTLLESPPEKRALSAEPAQHDFSLTRVAAEKLKDLAARGLYRTLRTVESRTGTSLVVDRRSVIDFSSNDYLGLSSDPRLASAARRALETNPAGAGASRLITGNYAIHELLEQKLAEHKSAESALLFGSGYLANLGCIPALVGRDDAIYCDALNHASLIDAARLSRAEVRVFRHTCMDDLDRLLSADTGKFRHRLIAVDSVFSMDGDLFPLDGLVEVARRHQVWTYVDDAHGTGVLGQAGRGACEHFGVEGEIDVVMGTLGKALGTIGAFAIGRTEVVDLLRNRARAFVFTTANPPAMVAASIEALRIADSDHSLRERLHENSIRLCDRLRERLDARYLPAMPHRVHHIVPIIVGDATRTRSIGERLFERGFLVGAIRPPTVPEGTSRLRITLSASHRHDDIDDLANCIAAELDS